MISFIQKCALVSSLLAISGCATLFGDNSRKVTVNSAPAGAGVYVDGVRYGTTPTTITLNSYIYGGKTVYIKKDGYADQATTVNAKFQPVGLFNLFFPIGFLIDLATGDIVKIDPETANIDGSLQKK